MLASRRSLYVGGCLVMVGICSSGSVNPNPSLPEIGEAYMISEKFDWLMPLSRRALATFLRRSPTASLPTRAS